MQEKESNILASYTKFLKLCIYYFKILINTYLSYGNFDQREEPREDVRCDFDVNHIDTVYETKIPQRF